jgi:hypothetical protein
MFIRKKNLREIANNLKQHKLYFLARICKRQKFQFSIDMLELYKNFNRGIHMYTRLDRY